MLEVTHPCFVCKEMYVGMTIKKVNHVLMCMRCYDEKGLHRFSLSNNMDPGEQPSILKCLSQVEEMLISRIAPVLQVTHARGGQYKYSGHTINFPQDISKIAITLPRHVKQLEILIVHRTNLQGLTYDYYVNRFHVMNALAYKMKHDQYYKDVVIDPDAVHLLPEQTTDITELLHSVHSLEEDVVQDTSTLVNINNEEQIRENSSSFIPQLPSSIPELDAIKNILHLDNSNNNVVPWPQIS